MVLLPTASYRVLAVHKKVIPRTPRNCFSWAATYCFLSPADIHPHTAPVTLHLNRSWEKKKRSNFHFKDRKWNFGTSKANTGSWTGTVLPSKEWRPFSLAVSYTLLNSSPRFGSALAASRIFTMLVQITGKGRKRHSEWSEWVIRIHQALRQGSESHPQTFPASGGKLNQHLLLNISTNKITPAYPENNEMWEALVGPHAVRNAAL